MKKLMWNETDGIWYDYDLETKVFDMLFVNTVTGK